MVPRETRDASTLVSLVWPGCRCARGRPGSFLELAERRFQAGLKKARADIDARRFEAAGRWLAAQSAWRPDHAEAAFLLGICEDAAGRHEAAAAAWARVPLESPLGLNAAIARARTLVGDLGRFADAEAVLASVAAEADRGRFRIATC